MAEATTGERWLPIPGHDGYEVSDLGRVRSLDRVILQKDGKQRRQRGQILSTWQDDNGGYLRVKLGVGRQHRVHLFVLEAFVGPCPRGMEALHGNGDPTDSRLCNLRWGTHSENCLDLVRHGTHQFARRTQCPRGHPLAAPNLAPRRDGARACWACAKAWHKIRRCRERGRPVPDFQAESDRMFRSIMDLAS